MADLNAKLNSNDIAKAGIASVVRMDYRQPVLIAYGDVRELTENGMGSLQEGNAGVAMMRFP